MGFVVKQPETIGLDVNVKLPDGSKQSFSIEAKYLSMSERKAFLKEINESEIEDIDVFKRLIVGWRGVREESGEDIPYGTEALERLVDIPCVYDAMMNAIVAEYLNPTPSYLQPFVRKN